MLVAHEITGPFSVGGVEILPFEQDHGWMKSLGFRFGKFAYSTDVVALDEAAFQILEGVDIWISGLCPDSTAPSRHAHLELGS